MAEKNLGAPFAAWIKKPKMVGWLNHLCALIFLVGLLIAMDGCALRLRRTVVVVEEPSSPVEVVYVQKAPPKPRVVVRPKKPTARAVWVPGHWQWNGRTYIWMSGHWERKPRGTAWVPGRWDKKARGWGWVPGHWR